MEVRKEEEGPRKHGLETPAQGCWWGKREAQCLTPSSPTTTPGQGLSLPEAIGGANPTHPHSQLGGWASLRCHPGFALRLHHLPAA